MTSIQPRDPLGSLLTGVRRRWRTQITLRTGGRAAAAASAPVLAAVLLARLVAPSDGALAVLVTTLCLTALAVTVLIVWRTERRPGDRQIARFIEERVAERGDVTPLNDVLVSAVDGDTGRELTFSNSFRALVVETAVRRLEGIGPASIVTTRAMRRAASESLAGATVLALSVALAWPVLARAAEAAWIALFPQSIRVEVLPGDTRLATGRPLTVRASVRTGRKLLTRFTPKLTVVAGAQERTVSMAREGEGFQFSFESVDRTFRYRVTAGSARSQEYTVTALVGPRVERIDLRYEYPAFSKLPPRDERDGGDIYAPLGTKVRVRIHTDKPIRSGEIAFGPRSPAPGPRSPIPDAPLTPLQRTGSRVLEADVILAKDDSYRVRLADEDGLLSPGDTEYFIRVMDDRPPDVRILRPAGDQQITPLEEVAIEARADDDYGISRFELVFAVAGREAKVVRFERATGTEVTRVGTHLLAAEDLRVQPGDVITYYARARDVGRGKRSTETRSDMFFLEVRPFSEEFVAAQSQAMAGMAGEQIEALIAAQKEIINATWSIERRAASGAGRSADDIKAIADAQAELKSRAEQIVSRGGRGRGLVRAPLQIAPQSTQTTRTGLAPQSTQTTRTGLAPQSTQTTQAGLAPQNTQTGLAPRTTQTTQTGQAPRPLRGSRPSTDPVGAAISAMGRALDQLQGERTGDALPHEMAALQGLLQAQAEIRRREVAQQAGSSFGGLGRQGQDLSALFDKELQRQQRTNYETRSQVEDRPDRKDGESALERIRDLARRQEELSRRQRELANAALSAEEMKRQLEKLMREQHALREQVEEMAREMGEAQRGGTHQQGQSGGGEMRDASEQMRNAVNDLQRQDPKTAADRAERAAAELRRLEQQLRGDSPEARQRAAGELRLEAQQIADEQRRIAGEAERLEKGTGAANADAWRRLAGEKEKLADRVDELRRATEQLASAERQQASTAQTGQTAAAARELSRRQIAQRMRETAKQMREATQATAAAGRAAKPPPRPGAAEAEQQIARALDQVVDQLGGAGGDAQDLSRELDQTRAIRENLDRLERQIRDARSKEAAGRQGRGSASGSAQGAELSRLRDQYAKELQRARDTLSRLERSAPGTGLGGTTPEHHEWSVVDQGTEGFKQDFSRWESLRKDINVALERYEASVVARAARKSLQDRLSAGGSDRVPDAYRRLIARYYESLAKKK